MVTFKWKVSSPSRLSWLSLETTWIAGWSVDHVSWRIFLNLKRAPQGVEWREYNVTLIGPEDHVAAIIKLWNKRRHQRAKNALQKQKINDAFLFLLGRLSCILQRFNSCRIQAIFQGKLRKVTLLGHFGGENRARNWNATQIFSGISFKVKKRTEGTIILLLTKHFPLQNFSTFPKK